MRRRTAMMLSVFVLLTISGCAGGQSIKDTVALESTLVENANATADVMITDEQSEPDDISTKTYTLEQLKIDFEQFQSIIETQHPMLYTDKAELTALFDSQRQLIHENMTEIEFYRILSPIVATLKCGHTSISISENYYDYMKKNGNVMPLMIKVIDNKAYLYKNLFSSQIPEGAQIVNINGQDIGDIIQIFLDNITADGENLTKKYYMMSHWFADMYFYYIGSPESFSVTYVDNSGETKTQIISAVTKEENDAAIYKVNSVDANYDKLYYREFNDDYALLRIKSFSFYEDNNRTIFKKFIDQFFDHMKEDSIPNLIIDLRDNWGGDPYCTAHLFSYLIDEPKPYFAKSAEYFTDLKRPITPAEDHYDGSVYVLIDGASFSSAGHISALLKNYNIATFLGEESGGSYLCSDSSKDIHLVNTQIRFHCATAPWEVVTTGLTPGRGIVPDYMITPTIEDYLNHKDVVMDAALALIAKG